MYVYQKSEPGLWTVGWTDPAGYWHTDSDHDTKEAAAQRVAFLNGDGKRAGDGGGPAFPTPTPFSGEGMCLRDWFAGQALAGAAAAGCLPVGPEDEQRRWAVVQARTYYQLADAMLAQRSKQ